MISTKKFEFHEGGGFSLHKSEFGFGFAYGYYATCQVKDLRSFKYSSNDGLNSPYLECREGRIRLPGNYNEPQVYEFSPPYTGELTVRSANLAAAAFWGFDGLAGP